MPARKNPPSAAECAKIAATLTGRKLTQQHKDNIGAANKGRRLTMQDRGRRSLTAMLDDRGAKLNRYLADNPELEALRRAKASANMTKINNTRRAERLAGPSPQPVYGASLRLRMLWRSSSKRRGVET